MGRESPREEEEGEGEEEPKAREEEEEKVEAATHFQLQLSFSSRKKHSIERELPKRTLKNMKHLDFRRKKIMIRIYPTRSHIYYDSNLNI